jgi:hypothetical protein
VAHSTLFEGVLRRAQDALKEILSIAAMRPMTIEEAIGSRKLSFIETLRDSLGCKQKGSTDPLGLCWREAAIYEVFAERPKSLCHRHARNGSGEWPNKEACSNRG